MKEFSIITCTYNSSKTILNNLESVRSQDFKNYEHIIIDNLSTDRTIQIIERFNSDNVRYYSENDSGIYDALNKGIEKAHGEYIIFLHSDDQFHDSKVLGDLNTFLKSKNKPTGLYGNIVILKKNKVYRKWKSKVPFKRIFLGWMPAHPSLILKKEIYQSFKFDTKFKISGDYDFIIRILKEENLTIVPFNRYLIKMIAGGISSNKKYFRLKFTEDIDVLRKNNYKCPKTILFLKKFRKLFQIQIFYFKKLCF